MTRRLDLVEPGLTPAPWGTTFLFSLGLHVFGLILAVALPRLAAGSATTPVYVVDLVSLPGGPANVSPPPAAAAAANPAPQPAPKEEKAIKLPDRDKKAEPKKTPEPRSTPAKPRASPTATPPAAKSEAKPEAGAEATPQPQASPSRGASMSGVSGGSGAAGGGFGGSGAGQADAEAFYTSVVTRNVENAWKKPIYPPTEAERRTFTTRIHFVLTSSGRVLSVEIQIPSGYEAMDRSVLEAVHEAMFPPFPSNIGKTSMPFTFELVLTKD